MVAVPYASAPTAWAPPTRYTSSASAMAAAARVSVGTVPSGPGGVTRTASSTPAALAGTTVMSTVDG